MDVTLLYIGMLCEENMSTAHVLGPVTSNLVFGHHSLTSLTDITPSQENKAQTMTGGGGFEIRQGL